MTKADLIEAIAAKLDGSKAEAGRALDAVTEALQEALAQGDEIKLPGFGAFAVT
jgi:DNA-binding protein HU-beta